MALSREEQVKGCKPLVLREVAAQIIAPRRVILTRLMLYYLPRRKSIERPWVSAYNALVSLTKEEPPRLLTEQIGDAAWYYLPNEGTARLEEAKKRKIPLYVEWLESQNRGARHAETLWRRAFADQGWVTDPSPRRVICPIRDDPDAGHSEEHEIDVYAELRRLNIAVGCEVKNGLGEGWIDPDIVRRWKLTEPMRDMRHHFKAMAALGVTPILVAPYVDSSFYVFQNYHQGLHANCLYHVFAPGDADLAARVRESFRLGHLWAGSEPPRNFSLFVRRAPNLVEQFAEPLEPEEPPDDEF